MADAQERATARQKEIAAAFREQIAVRQCLLINTLRMTGTPPNDVLGALHLQAVIEVFGERIAELEEEVENGFETLQDVRNDVRELEENVRQLRGGS